MSQQLLSEEISSVVEFVTPYVELNVDERAATEVAPELRQLSRELRAASKFLQSRNVDVMERANAVTELYYDLVFRQD